MSVLARTETPTHDPVFQFRAAMLEAGIDPPEVIEPDGKIHRFSTNGRPGDDAGSYVLHLDHLPAGTFGDRRKDIFKKWSAKPERSMTASERAEYRSRIDAVRRQCEGEEKRRRAEAAKKAAQLWNAATPALKDHPYLNNKQVSPVETLREIQADKAAAILGYQPNAKGEELTGRLLVAPVKVGRDFTTVELIDEHGRKSAIAGGAKAGGYWACG